MSGLNAGPVIIYIPFFKGEDGNIGGSVNFKKNVVYIGAEPVSLNDFIVSKEKPVFFKE